MAEGLTMYTMKDFERDYFMKHFMKLTRQEQEDFLRNVPQEARLAALTPKEKEAVLQTVPPEERLDGLPPEALLARLSEEQIRQYLEKLTAGRKAATRKSRRKKK
jgi:hypothetical protein